MPDLRSEFDLCISRHGPILCARSLIPEFMHSRQVPLSLGISYRLHDDKILIHPSVDPFLSGILGRVSCLYLIYPTLAWFSHLALLERTTHLILNNIYVPDQSISLDDAVSLSELTVADSCTVRLTSTFITTLNLVIMPIETSYYIFTNCPNLRKLYMSCQSYEGYSPGIPVDSFTLPRLELLHWELIANNRDKWCQAIMNHMHLPSLRTLEWDDRYRTPYPACRRAITRFFDRLPITLTSLTFYEINKDILFFPRADSHLESITFINCYATSFRSYLDNLRSPQQFPRLHTIKKIWEIRKELTTFWGDSIKRDPVPLHFLMEEESSRACLTMLRSRMSAPKRRLTMQLNEVDLGCFSETSAGSSSRRRSFKNYLSPIGVNQLQSTCTRQYGVLTKDMDEDDHVLPQRHEGEFSRDVVTCDV
ncbi:hypothetical protein Agabi119p4_1068 [Agaricus bisporus var. burnettii]|uniref:F-box domain-containing protein n=1 Tax=Agaricus bisporus var. burnettii TaxID=192524 RepID=A0A8H7FBP1_AGABI|nr:hypothetical protein Agabi119p4_1068 [Agaricus bisporus var. burnettii]